MPAGTPPVRRFACFLSDLEVPFRGARCRALTKLVAALLTLGCLGGLVFQWLERREELARYELNRAIYKSLVSSVDFKHCHDPAFKGLGFCRQHKELGVRLQLFFEQAGNSLSDKELWTWLGSFFFVFQVASTVGYATQGAPATAGGQVAAIVFGLIGIPLFGGALLLASKWLLQAARLAFSRLLGPGGGPEEERRQLLRLALLLVAVLWFGAALLFQLLEGWGYARAVFFCFTTLTTVGIGDDAPTTAVSRALCVVYVYLALSVSVGLVEAFSRRREDESPLVALAAGRQIGAGGRQGKVAVRACVASVVALCLCGGLVFPHLERAAELQRYELSRRFYDDLNALAEFKGCDQAIIKGMGFCRNFDWFRKHLSNFFGPNTPNSMVDRYHWTRFGSASFVLSVASTVGYGSQSPQTVEGQVATVLIGVLAIPLFWYCMIVWGAALRASVRGLVRRAGGSRDLAGIVAENRSLALLELLGIVVGLWLLGSAAFGAIEGWAYPTSLYFCFVTLSAVGFANVMPVTVGGRVLLLAYIAVGLTSVASLTGEVVGDLVEALGVDDEDEPAAEANGPAPQA